jgi:hypothetical protein
MSEEDEDTRDGAGLWARARPGWRALAATGNAPESAQEVSNPLILADYLDGTLDEAGCEAIEAWMAADPETLDLMIAARESLGSVPGAAPEALISRAKGLVRAPVRESAGAPGGLLAWLRGLIGFEPAAWRPLAWAGTAALLLVVSAGGFELGRLGTEQLVSVQTAVLGDDLDLDLGFDDPADDLI